MKIQTFSTIAVIQTAFLGDAALALFFAHELRVAHPSSRILFVTTPIAAPLARCSAAVDDVIVFDKRGVDDGVAGIIRMARLLRQRGVDLVFGLQRSARTSLVAALCGARMSVGFTTATASFLYRRRGSWNLHAHETERNHSLLTFFDDTAHVTIPQTVACRVSAPTHHEHDPQEVLDGHKERRAILAPGSVWATKRWPERSWVDLARALIDDGWMVELMGGPDDHDLCLRIAEASGASCPAAPLSLPESLQRLRSAGVLVTNDSAPTHLAAMVGTRTVTIYGSTIPEFGFAPRGHRDTVVETEGLSCRPCGLHGRHACPLGTLECMTRITPSRVREIVVAHGE